MLIAIVSTWLIVIQSAPCNELCVIGLTAIQLHQLDCHQGYDINCIQAIWFEILELVEIIQKDKMTKKKSRNWQQLVVHELIDRIYINFNLMMINDDLYAPITAANKKPLLWYPPRPCVSTHQYCRFHKNLPIYLTQLSHPKKGATCCSHGISLLKKN